MKICFFLDVGSFGIILVTVMSKPSSLIFLFFPVGLKCNGYCCFNLHAHVQSKKKKAGKRVISSASSGKQMAFLGTLLTVIHLHVIYIFLAETESFGHTSATGARKGGTWAAALAGPVVFHLLSGGRVSMLGRQWTVTAILNCMTRFWNFTMKSYLIFSSYTGNSIIYKIKEYYIYVYI